MTGYQSQAIFLFSLFATCLSSSSPSSQQDQDQREINDFLKTCPPSTCGSGAGSIQIRFPFRPHTSPPSCGLRGMEFTCSGDETLLSLSPSQPSLRVTAIDYEATRVTARIVAGYGSLSSSCPLQNLSSVNLLSSSPYSLIGGGVLIRVNCREKIKLGPDSGFDTLIVGPIPCLSGPDRYAYIMLDVVQALNDIPSSCVFADIGNWAALIDVYSDGIRNLGKSLDLFEKNREAFIHGEFSDFPGDCFECERRGRFCGFNWEKNQTFCFKSTHHGLGAMPIAGSSVGGFLVLVLVSAVLFHLSRKSKKEKETQLKVERFLAEYKTTKLTRYTFSGIKKITKRFRHKLGQGGFGSVYKGELPGGIPVAVKMLQKSRGEGDEFINEVATIGQIHHANVVRLLGFCSEGTNHALIYEFMANGSLEKFIFIEEGKRCYQPFTIERLLEISIGIAEGVEYLHQGCNQRILHFDIKPHNILLNHNFNPKISDFGLAKLCSRDHSIITMTAARGTMGYVAPEIYSRNFGAVSYKSDIYSFGMLLLEMVSGKRTVDPTIGSKNEVYFPEWIYGQLIQGEDIGLAKEREGDKEIINKLVIAALWCIQWNPIDRPCMTTIIQMLKGSLESLHIPPKPFFSSYEDYDTSVNII